jgi:hypothetical protein
LDINTLKRFRLLIPGFFILLLIILNISPSFDQLKEFINNIQIKDIAYSIICFIIGILYYSCDIRKLLWKKYNSRIVENIKDKLLEPIKEFSTANRIQCLKTGRKLMNIFYYFIDRDPSLKEKAKIVRLNGLFWTSAMDGTIIGLAGSLVFWIRFAIERTRYDLNVAVILLAFSCLCMILTKLLTRKHIGLSNEQLDVIYQLYKNELIVKLNELQ